MSLQETPNRVLRSRGLKSRSKSRKFSLEMHWVSVEETMSKACDSLSATKIRARRGRPPCSISETVLVYRRGVHRCPVPNYTNPSVSKLYLWNKRFLKKL